MVFEELLLYDGFMGILVTVFALGFVVFFHELGHMLFAKRFGIGVYEFSVGMGPKLVSKKFGETLYSIRVFPFGGYVKLAGLDDEGEVVTDESSFKSKKVSQRFWVLSGGSLMNIFLGFLIFFGMFMFLGVPKSTTEVVSVSPESPALVAGLQVGDVITEIDGKEVKHSGDTLIALVNGSGGHSFTVRVLRHDTLLDFDLAPKQDHGKWVIGVMLKGERSHVGFFKATQLAGYYVYKHVELAFVGLYKLISGQASMDQLTGPIGIVQFASFQFHEGFLQFFRVIAMISISLGVMNLLPFPVLDGGHLLFLLWEGLTGKPVSTKVEGYANTAGVAVLVGLMLMIVVNDIRFWGVRNEILKTLLG